MRRDYRAGCKARQVNRSVGNRLSQGKQLHAKARSRSLTTVHALNRRTFGCQTCHLQELDMVNLVDYIRPSASRYFRGVAASAIRLRTPAESVRRSMTWMHSSAFDPGFGQRQRGSSRRRHSKLRRTRSKAFWWQDAWDTPWSMLEVYLKALRTVTGRTDSGKPVGSSPGQMPPDLRIES
jgi:hypothetical protein